MNNLKASDQLRKLLHDYGDLFASELGELKGTEVELDIDPNAIPKFVKAHRVPFSLRVKLDQELDRLLKAGIMEPVQFSPEAAPIIPVMKGDGSGHRCEDHKVPVNLAACSGIYSIPLIDELFTKLSGGKLLTKLDLSHAFQQLALSKT